MHLIRRSIFLSLILFGSLFFTFCSKPPAAQSPKPLVVATIFNYYDALRAIAGDDADAVILLTPATSPHEYSPTAKDKATVSRAQLLIRNGLGIDDWARTLATDNPKLVQLVIGESIQAIETKEESLTDQPGHEAHDHGVKNPHIWLDPKNQEKIAEQILQALSEIDPAHKESYANRTAKYIADLEELDGQFLAAAKTFKYKEFVGFHSAYDYLAHRYGLKQVAALQEVGSDGMAPAQINRVIAIIKERHVPVVFSETALNSGQAEAVVSATGVKLGILQPLETYDDLNDTYLSLMRKNLEELKKNMQ
ncbi:MAG: metal ABC transporter substrate-binding protein [Phycisphaerales bacterium]|nr:metal ABC transporter substrate-binding protein [Phycisphaerales bacterium]